VDRKVVENLNVVREVRRQASEVDQKMGVSFKVWCGGNLQVMTAKKKRVGGLSKTDKQ
jgi:hypothetical protein